MSEETQSDTIKVYKDDITGNCWVEGNRPEEWCSKVNGQRYIGTLDLSSLKSQWQKEIIDVILDMKLTDEADELVLVRDIKEYARELTL